MHPRANRSTRPILPLLVISISCLFQVFPALAKTKPGYLLVNGGLSPSLNYEVHEEDLLAFQTYLFHNEALVLNAGGGPENKTVKLSEQGGVVKDPHGEPVLVPTRFPAAQRATRASFKDALEKLVKSRAESITVVFGDHGGMSGISMWNDERLKAEDLQTLSPPDRLTRSIHLHCYAGAALVNSDRVVPSSQKEFIAFVRTHYSPKRCGLAMSAEDEAGQYFSWATRWPKNPWSELLKSSPRQSLESLAAGLAADKRLHPLPILTSDYLMKDLTQYYCRLRAPKDCANCSTAGFLDPTLNETEYDRFLREVTSYCRQPQVQEELELTRDLKRAEQLNYQFGRMRVEWVIDSLYDLDPTKYITYKAELRRADDARAKDITDFKKVRPETEDAINEKLKPLASWYNDHFYKFFNSESPAFYEFLKTKAEPLMDKAPDDYAELRTEFHAHRVKLGAEFEKDGFRSLERALDVSRSMKQARRKELSLATRDTRVEFWSRWAWQLPSEIRKIFKGIQSCEESKI